MIAVEPKKITEEDAIKLLTESLNQPIAPQIFDKYGNYIFPTDIVMDDPNNACGTISSIIYNH